MDQLKEKFGVLLKYGFWICSAIVLIGSTVIWYLATSRLAQENAERTSKLNGDIQSVRSVRDQLDTHPNEISHQEMDTLIDGRKDQLVQAWTSVFNRQQDILTWPVDELKKDFVAEYEGKIPIEMYIDHPPTPEQEINTEKRGRYAYYIGNVLPEIAAIAKTDWQAEFSNKASGSAMGMGMDGYGGAMEGIGSRPRQTINITGTEERPLVEWSKTSQDKVLQDLFPWRGKRPTTLQVYYSQENIWILKQLLQIIAKVNGDAQQPFEAKIHKINEMAIGDSVEFNSGELANPGDDVKTGGYGGDMMEGYGDMGGMDDYGSDYGAMGGSLGGRPVEDPDPADNRYVDVQSQPIEAAMLRQRLKSNRPEDATIAVAKRVPVMMSVDIDQRFIPQLIAECGSAPLMVEVRQVRVLPKSKSSGGGMGGMGDEMGDMDYGDMGMGMSGMGPAPTAKEKEEYPLDLKAEVYGVIYIYNPPDDEKLGIEQVTQDTVIEGSTESSQRPSAAVEEPAETPAPAPAATDADDSSAADAPTSAPTPTPAPPSVSTPPAANVTSEPEVTSEPTANPDAAVPAGP